MAYKRSTENWDRFMPSTPAMGWRFNNDFLSNGSNGFMQRYAFLIKAASWEAITPTIPASWLYKGIDSHFSGEKGVEVHTALKDSIGPCERYIKNKFIRSSTKRLSLLPSLEPHSWHQSVNPAWTIAFIKPFVGGPNALSLFCIFQYAAERWTLR